MPDVTSVPTGTLCTVFQLEHFSVVFRLEHSTQCSNRNTGRLSATPPISSPPLRPTANCAQCSNRNIQSISPELAQCSYRNIGHVLHTIQLAHGNSNLHSKCESLYSANSSGSSTIYGTRHRCCQSEGRRGQDYDCHQPSRVLCGRGGEHTPHRLRSAIECHQRPGPDERSGTHLYVSPAAGRAHWRRGSGRNCTQ